MSVQLLDVNPDRPRGRQATPAKLASMAHAREAKKWHRVGARDEQGMG